MITKVNAIDPSKPVEKNGYYTKITEIEGKTSHHDKYINPEFSNFFGDILDGKLNQENIAINKDLNTALQRATKTKKK